MGENCARALENGPSPPEASNAALPFQFFIENIFKLKLLYLQRNSILHT